MLDGVTDFGWAGAPVAVGLLVGRETTTDLGHFELRAVVARAGTITAGGLHCRLQPGPRSLANM